MLTRTIPSSGEKLPVIGLGTWEQFDVSLSDSATSSLTQVLKTMIEKGGSVIDSSPMYARSEEVIGELTSSLPQREDFFYATKVWTAGKDAGIQQMKASLKKMKRSRMDLMQVHNLVDNQTHLDTLKGWKADGLVRYIGVTHYVSSAHKDLENIIKKYKVDFVQFNYSITERNAEKSLLKAASDHGVAVIINEPFDKGSLFKAVKNKTLPEWTAEFDITSWGQFFLKYILSQPAVTVIIPGTSDPKHALDNMLAGHGRIPDESIRREMVEVIQ